MSFTKEPQIKRFHFFYLTKTERSTFPLAVANAAGPILVTAKPSANVGLEVTSTSVPASNDLVNPGQFSDSTPYEKMS